MSPKLDVHDYYRRLTETDIAELARELLAGRVTEESPRTLFCDCPNHRSHSHRSLHIMMDKQGWYCFGCGVGGDALQLVEFVHAGVVTRGQSGVMPESHRAARDFLAARLGLPSLAQATAENPEAAEAAHVQTLRVREALTALAGSYHRRLVENQEVLSWFEARYRIGRETIDRLQIGFAANGGIIRELQSDPHGFTPREVSATAAFRPTAQDGLAPFFEGRIIFPYWSRGSVVFLIGRRTPWTPDEEWEKSKYKKLPIRNDRNQSHVAPCIRNDVLFNEDALIGAPERVIITEGVTDCISLMEHGFPAVSPVTVRIREADWDRLLPKLGGVKTVFICQDNEVSQAGAQGAMKTARILAQHGIATRVASLPLGEKQRTARDALAKLPADAPQPDSLVADAKIDVNEYFASGATATDFEAVLAAAQSPLELAISKLPESPESGDLARLLDPILTEVRQLDPIEQPRYLKRIQERCGKDQVPISALRQQMKVVRIDSTKSGGRRKGANYNRSGGPQPVAVIAGGSAAWRDQLLLNLNGTVKPVLANAITALRNAPEWAEALAFNEFAHFTVLQKPAPWMKANAQMPADWSPNDDILATEWLHHQGIFVSVESAGQAVESVARERPFHPVRAYLRELAWDGQSRLRSWLADYLGVEPSPYAAAVGSRWLISAVARVFEPGCKADCCLILEGEQGIRKSTALRVLTQPWFTDEIADLGSKDAALQTRGVWVIEIAELDSMSRSDVGKIKAFMSRATDRFRPPYGKRTIESPRQCVFAGSVNHGTYLRDETGGRRFWPVECKAPAIDVDSLAEVRDQLWAEANALYFDGKPWWLDSVELNREASREQEERYEGDPWDELILEWAEGRESVSIADVLSLCLEKKKDLWTQWDRSRVARCLRANGWIRFNARSGGLREWRYRRVE